MQFNINIAETPFGKRIKYVFDFIAHHPLADGLISFSFSSDNSKNSISYGIDSPASFYIPAQGLIFNTKPIHPAQLIFNTYQSKELTLFSVEQKEEPEKYFLTGNQFSFDIIETIFFHISRYEEHVIAPDMKANWGMASKENHFIPRNNLQETPIVDHLVFSFLEAIGAQPKKKKTTYRLTHDVDNPLKFPSFYKFIKASGRLLLVERKGLSAQINLFRTFRKMKKGSIPDPYDTFDWLFQKEEIEKVVYFMAGGRTKFDNFYQIDSPVAKRIIKQAQNKGYKFGLHPSYEAYANEEQYAKEKKALEQVLGEKVVLTRQHYLRFQFPETADIIDNQGIIEDSTLGYRDMIGFRCGTGFGYRLYNFKAERAYDFVEVPLVVMEWSLIQQEHYDMQKIKEHLHTFLKANQYFTKVTILFHNSIFDQIGDSRKELEKIYADLTQQIY